MSEERNNDHTGPFTRASRLLRKKKLTADEANELTEIFENMASANLIAQFGAKLDTVNATMSTQLDAVNATMKAQLDAVNATMNTQLDAVNATMKAQLDAVNTKYNVLIWVIGFATIILSAVIVLT
ncbi:MAG: hypothetical protein OXD43_01690 [Bacteroidetes bacterium]|nr:hypothetical protein [Bacteroidota bacterium]